MERGSLDLEALCALLPWPPNWRAPLKSTERIGLKVTRFGNQREGKRKISRTERTFPVQRVCGKPQRPQRPILEVQRVTALSRQLARDRLFKMARVGQSSEVRIRVPFFL